MMPYLGALRDRRRPEDDPHESGGDHDQDAGREQVGRDGERLARLAQTAQVRRRQQRHQTDGDQHAVPVSEGNAEMMLSVPEETDTATVST